MGRKRIYTDEERKQRRRESDKKYREENPDYNKQWLEANPEYNKQYCVDNKEAIREQQRTYREENKEAIRERDKQYGKHYREENKENRKQHSKRYREANPDKCAYNNRLRNTRLEDQTPPWYETEQVKLLYLKCAELNKRYNLTGPDKLTVDHIIPLKGKLVSSLHCWANLQILCKSLNSSKNNRCDV